jgi:hypothetical protein
MGKTVRPQGHHRRLKSGSSWQKSGGPYQADGPYTDGFGEEIDFIAAAFGDWGKETERFIKRCLTHYRYEP